MRKFVGMLVAAVALVSLAPTRTVAQRPAESIPLPNGFSPEGIDVGTGSTFYVGSLRDGDIYRGDLRTKEGAVFVDAPSGRTAVGLKADVAGRRLFVAGGPTGRAFIYDLDSGADLGAITLATTAGPTFINDVVLTHRAAWFTDSNRGVLYRLPLLPGGGVGPPEVLQLRGPGAGLPGAFNINGIAATPGGRTLIVMHSALAALFTVDPATGETSPIDVGQAVSNGDGILLVGRRLWVVQNFLNQVIEVRLSGDLSSGVVTDTITDPLLRIPTTVARFGGRLAVVNARFNLGIPGPINAEYDVVLLPR